jgi:hypothetical protein
VAQWECSVEVALDSAILLAGSTSFAMLKA